MPPVWPLPDTATMTPVGGVDLEPEEATRLALSSKRLGEIARWQTQVAERFRAALDPKRELEQALRPFLIRWHSSPNPPVALTRVTEHPNGG